MKKNERLLSIDLARILAAIAVIIIHVVSVSYFWIDKIGYKNWAVTSLIGWLLIWATPMFVVISGYLLINDKKINNLRDFYGKRFKKILIPFIFWNIFYYLISKNSSEYSWPDFWLSLKNSRIYGHLYFLNIIMGLYIITPLLVKLVNKINATWLVILMIILSSGYHFAYCFGKFPKLNNIFLTFIPYIGYYLAGYWVGKKIKIRFYKIIMILSSLLLIISTLITRKLVFIFETHDQDTILVSNLSLPVAIFTLILFYGLIRIKNYYFKKYKLIEILSELTLGVYLVHPFWIKVWQSTLCFDYLFRNCYLIWFGLLTIVTIFTSFVSVYFIQKIPVIRKIIGG